MDDEIVLPVVAVVPGGLGRAGGPSATPGAGRAIGRGLGRGWFLNLSLSFCFVCAFDQHVMARLCAESVQSPYAAGQAQGCRNGQVLAVVVVVFSLLWLTCFWCSAIEAPGDEAPTPPAAAAHPRRAVLPTSPRTAQPPPGLRGER